MGLVVATPTILAVTTLGLDGCRIGLYLGIVLGGTLRAHALGADAVVGVALEYEVIGQGGSIITVTATGTAVVLEPAPR